MSKKVSVHVKYGCIFFSLNIFNLRLVEFLDMEPVVTEGHCFLN
jgi:hypothetical protein